MARGDNPQPRICRDAIMQAMAIAIVQPLYSGNALRLFMEPPIGAVRWKVLRKGSNTFSGAIDDASALVAYDGDDKIFIDTTALQNEVMAFYQPWYWNGTAWTAGAVAHGTPAATYQEYSTDVLSFMRERIEAGLLVEVQRGNLQSDIGYVQVYTAPPSMERDLRFPLVTVHLENEEPGERAIGENISGDEFDAIGFGWEESEGWLANVGVTIIGWSLNSDERIELRKAIRRIVIANLEVFAEKGWLQVALQAQDVDAVNGEYPAQLYQVMNNFSCLAPVRVGGIDKNAATVADVTTTQGVI